MSNKILNTRILLLNGSQAQWETKKTAVLKKGEPGAEFIPVEGSTLTDVKVKIGDGITTWENLPYIGEVHTKQYVDTAIAALLDDKSLEFTKDSKNNDVAQIFGFDDAGANTLPQKTASGKIEWKAVSAIVQGDGNTVTQGDGKSIDTLETESITDDAYVAQVHGFTGATENQVPHKVGNEIVWKDVVTTDSKSVVSAGGGIDVESETSGDTTTYTVKHKDTSSVTNVIETDRTYVKSLTFDEFGHVTTVTTGKETVVDTNTAHTHSVGDGLKQSSSGGTSGEVKTELQLALTFENDTLFLVDSETNAEIAKLEKSGFVKDGMIKSVELITSDDSHTEENGPYLVFTWNIDDATGTDADTNVDVLWVPVKDLVDVYNSGTYITVSADNTINHNSTTRADGSNEGATLEHGGKFIVVDEVISNETGHVTGVNTKEYTLPSMEHNHDDKYAPKDGVVTKITSNDSTATTANIEGDNALESDSNVSGLKITPAAGTGEVNIEIDDTVTFILDGGTVVDLL